MVDPALIVQSRRLLNQARLIAEAPAAQMSPIGSGHASSQFPPGLVISKAGALLTSTRSTLQACGERINLAIAHDSNEELRAANRWCEQEMDSLTKAALRGPETPLEFRARICSQYQGVLAGVVARAEMTSVTTVRKIRVEGGRDARTGREAQ